MLRYLLALTISVLGVIGSYVWLRPHDWHTPTTTTQEPLALLKDHSNDVRKKVRGKIIWTPIKNGDMLYQGEMVRTSNLSTALIEFVKSKTVIELEASSSIVIEKLKEQMTLNVLSGGIFVKSVEKDNAEKQKLVLKSGKKKVSLKSGEVSFSIDKKGGVEVQVSKGSVEADVGGKTVILTDKESGKLLESGIKKEKNRFKDLQPEREASIYFTLNQKKRTTFHWAPLSPEYLISLSMGTKRKILRRFKTAPVNGNLGKITVPVHLGSYFWRLNATPKDPKQTSFKSLAQRITFRNLRPPIAISPTHSRRIYLTNPGQSINFKWSTPSPLEQASILISLKKDFSKLIVEDLVKTKHQYNSSDLVKTGTYWWKIKGILQGTNKLIVSETNSFILRFGKGISPPHLTYPGTKENIILDKKTTISVLFNWEENRQAVAYKFKLQGVNSLTKYKFEKKIRSPQIEVNKLQQGKYTYVVASIDQDSNLSEYSEKRLFSIIKLPIFSWKNMLNQYFYVTERPEVRLNWSSKRYSADHWTVKIDNNKNLNTAREFKTTKPQLTFAPDADGTFYAKVWAYNRKKQISGHSPLASFKVKKEPLPLAPQFSKKLANPIRASSSGRVKIIFRKDRAIKGFLVEVKDLKGNIIQQLNFKQNWGKIQALMPGQYLISAKAIDRFGRMGNPGETRRLLVPTHSAISAPKVNKIRIR